MKREYLACYIAPPVLMVSLLITFTWLAEIIPTLHAGMNLVAGFLLIDKSYGAIGLIAPLGFASATMSAVCVSCKTTTRIAAKIDLSAIKEDGPKARRKRLEAEYRKVPGVIELLKVDYIALKWILILSPLSAITTLIAAIEFAHDPIICSVLLIVFLASLACIMAALSCLHEARQNKQSFGPEWA